ncbi:MAG: VOC family protein [Chloroflexi bacterium]|nr:VOC family protein [Chloroflexota bacterium]
MPVTGIEKKIISQVCIIVRDVEASTARYAEILGIDMSANFQTTRLHDHTHATYYGKPTDARASLTSIDIGNLQFELLQPLEQMSSWRDFLDLHGEGIHHIAFFVPKTDVPARSFEQAGYVITQQGLFTGQTGMYTYLDTDRDLGVVIELLEHFAGSPVLNGPPFPADKGLGTDIVCQVGIIVRDIERTARRYSDLLGMPMPPLITTAGYDITKTLYKGEPSDATAQLAFFDFGQVQIELIQPDEKPSIWRDWLEANGEGAHHIAFRVQNTQRAVDHLAKFGITVTQQGLYSDGSGVYTYLDSQQQLGTTLELLEDFPR